MLIVNLLGSPGAGKSTGAAYIYAKLKMNGINAELVTEFAKDKLWEGSLASFENQAYIFGEQFFRISRLENKVDVVVTDSPLLLSVYYNKNEKLDESFDNMVKEVFLSYDSFNAFIVRIKQYNENGRFQTEEESNIVSSEIIELLQNLNINYKTYSGDIEGYDKIVQDVIEALKNKKGRNDL